MMDGPNDWGQPRRPRLGNYYEDIKADPTFLIPDEEDKKALDEFCLSHFIGGFLPSKNWRLVINIADERRLSVTILTKGFLFYNEYLTFSYPYTNTHLPSKLEHFKQIFLKVRAETNPNECIKSRDRLRRRVYVL